MAKNIVEVPAAEAVKLFAGVQVQDAVPGKRKLDDGRTVEALQGEMAKLAARHVLACRRYEDGSVVLVTIDGQRHVRAAGAAEKQ